MSGSVLDRNSEPMVEWGRIGETAFSRLIEALAQRKHPRAREVRPVDGRGGDGGVDIYVLEEDGREIIYQLKYFPEGFDGKHRDRRRQISNPNAKDLGSLERALSSYPNLHEWILVAPCKPTRSGWVFIEKLRNDHPWVTITFVHAAKLDSDWVAPYPEVVRSQLTRDELLEKAAILNAERAVLAGGYSDLLQRHQDLDHVAADADPDWRWVPFTKGGEWGATLTARHARAADVSPVSISLTVNMSNGGVEAEAFTRAVGYGTFETVRLPGQFIHNFEVTGPPLVSSATPTGEIAELVLEPIDSTEQPRSLALSLRADDHHLATHQGVVTQVANGVQGWSMRQTFHHGTVVLAWALPFEKHSPCQVNVTVDFTAPGVTAADVRGACDLLLAWRDSSRTSLVTPEGRTVALLGGAGMHHSPEMVESLAVVREFADDVDFVEREVSRQFRWPANDVTDHHRIDMRILRRLLEGKVVCRPDNPVLNVTLDPSKSDESTQAHLAGEGGQILHHAERVEWSVEAMTDQGAVASVELENYVTYFPHLKVEGGASAFELGRREEELKVRLLPQQQRHPRIYLVDRQPPGATITPVPWGLIGIAEVPELTGTAD